MSREALGRILSGRPADEILDNIHALLQGPPSVRVPGWLGVWKGGGGIPEQVRTHEGVWLQKSSRFLRSCLAPEKVSFLGISLGGAWRDRGCFHTHIYQSPSAPPLPVNAPPPRSGDQDPEGRGGPQGVRHHQVDHEGPRAGP